MYDQAIDTPPRLSLGHHCVRSGPALVPLLAALGFVLFTTLRCPLKDDIAWLLYVAQQWLAGRQLYVDLIEVNPPMIVWILALPAALSAALGVAAKFAAVPFFAACVLSSAGGCARLLRGYGPLGAAPLPLFAATGTVLLVLPDPNSGSASICSWLLPCLTFASSRAASMAGQPSPLARPSPESSPASAARSNPNSSWPLFYSKSSAACEGCGWCGE